MSFSTKDYMRRPRDSKREYELARKLRQLPEEARFAAIQEFIQFNLFMGLNVAYTCLRTPVYFRRMLDQALDTADASSIQYWLECIVPKLGFRRVLYVLSRKMEAQPASVDNALYFMGKFLPPADITALERLQGLRRVVQGLNTPGA